MVSSLQRTNTHPYRTKQGDAVVSREYVSVFSRALKINATPQLQFTIPLKGQRKKAIY